MPANIGSLQDYRTGVASALGAESDIESLNQDDVRSLAADVDRETYEAEIFPLLRQFLEDSINNNIGVSDNKTETRSQYDLVITDRTGEPDTIFEFESGTDLGEGPDLANKYLTSTSARNIVLTNGLEFKVFSQIGDEAELTHHFTITEPTEILAQLFESLFSKTVPETDIEIVVADLRSEYSDVLRNQLKYYVRVFKFARTLDNQASGTLDQTHRYLIDEAGFDADTVSQLAQTMAGILRNKADQWAVAGELRLADPQNEPRVGEVPDTPENAEVVDVFSEEEISSLNELFEDLAPPDPDVDDPLSVLASPEFYKALASLVDQLAGEYEWLLEERYAISDGGWNEETTTIAFFIGIISLTLWTIGYSIPFGVVALIVTLFSMFDFNEFINPRDYTR